MKRSEILKLLEDIIQTKAEAGYNSVENADEVAENVLRSLEEVGMLPPTIIKERLVSNVKSVDKAARSLTIGSAYEIGPTNEWEKE